MCIDSEGRITPLPTLCPFCGSDDIRQSWNEDGDYLIRCLTCRGAGPSSRDAKQATLLWNQRPFPTINELI